MSFKTCEQSEFPILPRLASRVPHLMHLAFARIPVHHRDMRCFQSDLAQFAVDVAEGRMTRARQVPSPNCDARPAEIEPELIVVHGISLPPGDFGGPWIEKLFTNELPPDEHSYFKEIANRKVSSHLLIRRDGEVVQFVPFHRRAWHAGVSNFQGRERCNDFSIGIELEGADDIAYEPVQYRALALSIAALCRAYPSLSTERIVGHSDIAPGRKTDPGDAFDWPRLKALVRAVTEIETRDTRRET